MARYIDADKLLKNLPNDLPYKGSVKRVLIQAPTADVEEVVRCKDCKHWDKFPDSHRTDGICKELVKWHSAEKYMTEAEHFCGYGKWE